MTDDGDDFGPDLVERLAKLDDRLRAGAASAEVVEDDLEPLESTSQLNDLWACVQALEQRWPRTAATLQPAPVAASPVALHPVLRLSLAGGDDLPRFGKFKLKGELGRGGFGVVLLAEDTVLGRDVALKLPRPELLLDEGMKRRFLQEARAAAAIDHPHVAPVYEAGEIGELCYLAAAYCPGETLAHWLARLGGPTTPRLAARLIETLALALQHIHDQGVLHRDLKPGNVLLWPAAEPVDADELPFVPKLTDFGLSKVLAESIAESRTSVLMGTPLYMAPEQAEGRLAEIGPATDVFALGAMLYELLTGQLPFPGASLAEVFDKVRNAEPPAICKQRPEVPRELEIICLKCLQKRPADRYGSAQALAADLGRFLKGENVTARPTPNWLRFVRWCEQPQRLREAGLAVIAVNIVAHGWTVFTAMMLAWGFVPRPANLTVADVYRTTLPIIVLVAPPMMAAGFGVMSGKRWAIQFLFGTGAGLTFVAILLSLSLLENPYAGLWNHMPGFSMVMFSMMAMLYLVQTLASVIAWMAVRRVR